MSADRAASGRRARRTGQRWERECWHLLRLYWPNVVPTRQVVRNTAAKVPDIDGEGCPFWVECGYSNSIDSITLVQIKWAQAWNDSANDMRRPLVMVRKARHEPLIATHVTLWESQFGVTVRKEARRFIEWPAQDGPSIVAVTWDEFVRLTEHKQVENQ